MARELAHRLNNQLALAVGLLDLIESDPSLPVHLRPRAAEAIETLERIADELATAERLDRSATKDTAVGPVLDLEQSTRPA